MVEGRGRFRVAGEEQSLGAGEGVMAGSGDVHGIANDSEERLVVLTLMAPPPR